MSTLFDRRPEAKPPINEEKEVELIAA